jgi:hypothetical protein
MREQAMIDEQSRNPNNKISKQVMTSAIAASISNFN